MARRLRAIAFGRTPDGLPAHPYGTPDSTPSSEHVFGLCESHGHAVFILRLFRHLNYRLDFPDIPLARSVQVSLPVPGVPR